ncbi:unnamed protein product [Moneuplotes crassus]|uniref:Coiled-coil domain-containing protein n=1 Tax=Euplotes crassus TaxID=5936 RepID=A0AAD1XVY2_EUPCR|nr:unnamed protein product [Moneuplotes crassus]
MGKNWGKDPRVEEARQRKENAKQSKRRKALERCNKAKEEEKKMEKAKAKEEVKELLKQEEEELELANKKKPGKTKYRKTKGQIDKMQAKYLKTLQKQIKKKKEEEAGIIDEIPVNMNHVYRDEMIKAQEEGKEYAAASGIDGAIGITNSEEPADRHPEKRRKALFQEYLYENLPRIREETPGLKKSQYQERLFKEFKKLHKDDF